MLYYSNIFAFSYHPEVVLEAFHKEKAIDTKTCGTDLVTETDKYVEELIIGTLLEKFPTHRYVPENCMKISHEHSVQCLVQYL